MTPQNTCQLRIRTDWDASAFVQRPELVRDLDAVMERLGPLAAPTLSGFPTALRARRKYCPGRVDRNRLAASLEAWHRHAGAPQASLQACRRLREGDTWLAVTGQQPGLLLGPMYTLIKAVQTVRLAEKLTREGFGTVLPAFWVASEDHQPQELNHAAWLGNGKQLEEFDFKETGAERWCAWARKPGAPEREALIERLRATLPETPHRADILQTVQETQRGSLADGFQALLWAWLEESGLIVLRPDMPFLQDSATEIFAREIEEPLASTQAAMEAAARMESLGIAGQVHKRADRTAFFIVEDGIRQPVFHDGHSFEIEGRRLGKEEFAGLLRETPGSFSSTAILRPVIQDALLPVVATVLGPNELAYHLQLGGIYTRHGVPRPAVVRRVGLTLLESRDEKHLEELKLRPADLLEDPRALAKRIAERGLNNAVSARHEEALESIGRFYATVQSEAAEIDKTVKAPLEKQQRQVEKGLATSLNLLNRRRSDRDAVSQRRIQQLQAQVLPGRHLQERVLGPASFLARHSGFVDALGEAVSQLKPGAHAIAIVEN